MFRHLILAKLDCKRNQNVKRWVKNVDELKPKEEKWSSRKERIETARRWQWRRRQQQQQHYSDFRSRSSSAHTNWWERLQNVLLGCMHSRSLSEKRICIANVAQNCDVYVNFSSSELNSSRKRSKQTKNWTLLWLIGATATGKNSRNSLWLLSSVASKIR